MKYPQAALLGKDNRMNLEQRRIIAACYCRLSDDDAQDGMSISIETCLGRDR